MRMLTRCAQVMHSVQTDEQLECARRYVKLWYIQQTKRLTMGDALSLYNVLDNTYHQVACRKSLVCREKWL
jgi:hypothetical protein